MKTTLQDKTFEEKRALAPFLKKLFRYSLRYKQWLVPFVVATVAVAIVEALMPLVWLHFIDHLITPEVLAYKEASAAGMPYATNGWAFVGYGAVYLALTAILVWGVFVFIKYAGSIQEHILYDMRKDMFNKLQHLSFSYYDKAAMGWLISRITSDTDRVAELISWGLLSLIWGLIMILGCFVAMFIYSWQLGLIVFATIPLLLVFSIKVRMLVLKYSRKARKINSEMTANYNEHVNGIEVNKISVQEERASQGFYKMSKRMKRVSFRAAFYSATYTPLVVMVGSIAAALVIYAGGSYTMAGATGITLGTLAAFFGYARMIFEPILDISRFYALAQNSLSAGERIFSLIEEEIEIKDAAGTSAYHTIKGEVQFDEVDFHYLKDHPILENFNLTIKAGESVALVGPTGEGKSTIASLMCRFYEPVGGSVKIDGIDYRKKTLHSFRNQLGVILQTPHLFSGTVIDNIRYGHQEASEERIKMVLKQIGAEELCERLQEEVGEEGGNLSIGEKQLISFARVIVKDPRILVMDEATSSVDVLVEARIQKGIDRLMQGRTSLIIAHRLSTIKNCDRILVIQKGKVVEEGSHDALMALRGFYYQLYTRQSRNVA